MINLLLDLLLKCVNVYILTVIMKRNAFAKDGCNKVNDIT